jgi:hypothetical protein
VFLSDLKRLRSSNPSRNIDTKRTKRSGVIEVIGVKGEIAGIEARIAIIRK